MTDELQDSLPMIPTVCKLCQCRTDEVGPLQHSHIIPRFVAKLVKEDGKSVVFSERLGRHIGQSDWVELMMCRKCEQLFSNRYENFLKSTLFTGKRLPVISQDSRRVTLRGSNDRMALGLLSIFWRAAMARREEF